MHYDNIIIGAGIAGACIAKHLIQQGQSVLVLDAQAIGAGASGNEAAALYPLFTAAPSKMGSFYVQAYAYALEFYGHLLEKIPVVCAPKKPEDLSRWQRIVDQPEFAPYAEFTGQNLVHRRGGLLRPKKVLAALFEKCTIHIETVTSYQKTVNGYQFNNYHGRKLFICNGWQAKQFLPELSITPVRGQITYVKTAHSFDKVQCQDGYALSTSKSTGLVGSTYSRFDIDLNIRKADNQQNLQRWQTITGDNTAQATGARAAIRGRSKDTLPYYQQVEKGLYVLAALGSRGFTTAPYCAKILTS